MSTFIFRVATPFLLLKSGSVAKQSHPRGLFAAGPALPHSHIPLKGKFDTSYSLSGRIIGHSSHCTVYTNAGMVHWLNVDYLELLSHNINDVASSIPGHNK